MLRGSDLIDLPVIELSENKRLSYIKSLIIDIKKNKVDAILLKKNLVIYNNLIFIDNIKFIKNDVVYICKFQYRKNNFNINTPWLIDYFNMLNKTVVNLEGNIVGVIRDIWLNEINWDFVGYEMSEGYIDDIISGRKQLKNYDVYCIEKDRIIIS